MGTNRKINYTPNNQTIKRAYITKTHIVRKAVVTSLKGLTMITSENQNMTN